MIEHEDGSVTLSAEQFKLMAIFLEINHVNLKQLLEENGDEISFDDLLCDIHQLISLHAVEPHDQPN